MTRTYDPPEDTIADVIARTQGDPRALAIAYLRAQKRARDAENAFKLACDLDAARENIAAGDGDAAISRLERAARRTQQHNAGHG